MKIWEVSVNGPVLAAAVPLATALMLLCLATHACCVDAGELSSKNLSGYGWIPLYDGFLAQVISIATLIVLPVTIAIWLVARVGNQTGNVPILGAVFIVATALLGIQVFVCIKAMRDQARV